ncbi:MAG: hypothetical protein JWN99_1633, partial [Ilumatobacteraceae bacterium]|nr:hypothetical protein [Ilumatobacteraceae bacterium]
DVSGTTAIANNFGIYVRPDVAGTSIRFNTISGNTSSAVSLNGTNVANTTLYGNIIGLDPAQTVAVPNGTGVVLNGPDVNNTQIGTGLPGAENIIAGNSGDGVLVNGDTTGATIDGNLIGVDSNGVARPNSVGVELNGASNVSIGTNLGGAHRNVISGNALPIYVHQPDSGPTPTLSLTGTKILGNYIGTDPTGMTEVPNSGGIYIGGTGNPNADGYVTGTMIGDGTVNGRNVISGNLTEAISLWDRADSTSIVGNDIGVAQDRSTPLGNNLDGFGDGAIVIRNYVVGALIDSNIIANNGDDGVVVYSGTGNHITRNTMYDNLGAGINISGAAVNDVDDADGGANFGQNFPSSVSTYIQGSLLRANWTIDSLPGNTTYPVTIEFFKADSSTSGEGRLFLASHTEAGPAQFIGDIVGNAAAMGISVGEYVVATITDANGNTSDFSAPAVVSTLLGPVTVNSVLDGSDSNPGNGVCETATNNGICTLRAAIQETNAVAGADVVQFGIPLGGLHTINLGTNLPNITDPLTIDGLSQPGATCATWPPQLMIEIDGSQVVGNSWGITVDATSATLRGLVINHFTIDGVAAYNSTGGSLECNIIGAEPDGTPGTGVTQSGVFLSGGANWRIGGPLVSQRNLITGPNLAYQIGLTAATSVVQNNYIGTDINGDPFATPFPTNRAIMVTGPGNLIGGAGAGQGNVIAGSSGPGIWAAFDTGNTFRGNSIKSNLGLGIDIGPGFGVTFNHFGFVSGPNDYQNYPVLTAATSTPGETRVVGTLDGLSGNTYAIDVYSTDVCDVSGFGSGDVYLGTFSTTVGANGIATFNNTVALGTSEPKGITTTATDLTTGSTSEFSYCRAASTPNLTWVTAQSVSSGTSTQQYITDRQQEKWFKIAVQPGDEVKVQLTGLPGSAVSLHRDPNPIYNGLTNPNSAAALSAEAADTAFLPSGSLPSGSLPSGSLPSGSLPSGSLPSGSLPTGFLPSGSLPSGSLPSGSLPSGSLPSGSLPSGSLPSGSLPSGSLPSGSLPSGSLPSGSLPSGSLPSGSLPSGSLPSGSLPSGSLDAYSSAARRSLMGLAADPYAAVQTIDRDTFDLQEDLYVRVVGPYDLSTPFSVKVTITGGVCSAVTTPPSNLAVIDGSPLANTGRSTVILTDSSRLPGTAGPTGTIATALADLQTLSNRADVGGVVVDLHDAKYQRVAFANAQADQYKGCPGAKNIVANEIKAVINAYRTANTVGAATSLKYVVLAGGADVIPFQQVQDIAGLANEKEYVPPVQPNSPSEAGLRSGLVKGQDFYGSALDLTIGGNTLAIPDLAVGRLVDTAADVSASVAAYVATDGAVQPQSSLITGYDFVGDAAKAVQTEVEAGTGNAADTLIQDPGHAPSAPDAWSADQLRSKLLAGNHDVVMMSGHFSSGTLLAADYRTSMSASEVQNTAADLTDTIVLALGCHSGFSLPTSDLLSGASPDPDWAKAFLRKGAAGFVAATGYAYGDTELTEYGERLFVGLSQQLRYGSGPIPLGQALVNAKRAYLANTAQVTGIDQKTIVEMTLYGLPMMKVDMPTGRIAAPTDAPIVGTPGDVPGSTTGLTSTAAVLNPTTAPVLVPLTNLATNSSVTTTYYTGREGVVANPFEPILPKQIDNVTASGKVLRGVAFRGGTYTDVPGITPLTTAPTTETSTVHQSFNTDVFYPNQVWMPNYYDAVNGGPTRLVTVPAQFRSSSPGSTTGTVRKFSNVNLALYYLPSNWTTAGSPAVKGAAVSAAPTIEGASASISGQIVTFSVHAQADGSAGVKSVWIVYTGEAGSTFHGTWAPVDLAQDTTDPTLWTGALNIGANDPASIKFMVQAVNGAGLATLSTNLGAYYGIPGSDTPPAPAITSLAVVSAPTSGPFQTPQTFSARLTSGGNPVVGQTLVFGIGDQQAQALTDGTGLATVEITPRLKPDAYDLQISSKGTA